MTDASGSRANIPSINVTPMIDILLVLLIIFMVIVPALPRGEAALVPAPPRDGKVHAESVVLEVLKQGGSAIGYRVNQQPVERKDLPAKLAGIFANRGERVLFVKGDGDVSFTEIAGVIDIGHAAGIEHIGLLTPGSEMAR